MNLIQLLQIVQELNATRAMQTGIARYCTQGLHEVECTGSWQAEGRERESGLFALGRVCSRSGCLRTSPCSCDWKAIPIVTAPTDRIVAQRILFRQPNCRRSAVRCFVFYHVAHWTPAVHPTLRSDGPWSYWSCRCNESTSLNCCQQREYYSSRRWYNIDRRKLAIRPPELSGSRTNCHLEANQDELGEGHDEFGLRNFFAHISKCIFLLLKCCDMGPTADLALRRKVCCGILSPRPVSNPVKLGSNGKHANRHATEGTLVPSLAQRPVATYFHVCVCPSRNF
jgi:hypothetical protein